MSFNVGDRVLYINYNSKNYNLLGTVKRIPQGDWHTYEVSLDNGGSVYDVEDQFSLLVLDGSQRQKEYTLEEYTLKCAKWFDSAYAAITKAGGNPEKFINDIPTNVIENMIRNNIHLEYKK